MALSLRGARSAHKQAYTAEKGQITERFSKAVDALAAMRHETVVHDGDNGQELRSVEKPSITRRIGGLYTLEQISRDSERDHIVVMDTICDCVRFETDRTEENDGLLDSVYESADATYKSRADIFAAILVLGKRNVARIRLEQEKDFKLVLTGANLFQLDFDDGNFERCIFGNSDLRRSSFARAKLKFAKLHNVMLCGSVFADCDLRGAQLAQADFTDAEDLTASQIRYAFGVIGGDYETILPAEIKSIASEWDWFRPEPEPMSSPEFHKAYSAAYKVFAKAHRAEIAK